MYHFSSPYGDKTLIFRHFARKGYSLFAALGHEVKVSVLSVATLATAAPALAAANGSVTLGTDTIGQTTDNGMTALLLDEATAVASRAPMAANAAARTVMTFSRDDIAAAGVTSINDILKLCAGIDVRQRGAFGIQTDIAVDGGTFDQVTILLNGTNISSPHTGHLSADFPVTAIDIERIEVLEGPAARIYGTSAFTGAINIVTRHEQRSAVLHAFGGMYGLAGGEGRLSLPLSVPHGSLHNHVSGGFTRSDGATPNSEFRSSRLFWQGNFTASHAALDYQLGYSAKPYAANTFYGAASPDQWESNERWMGAMRLTTHIAGLHLAPSFSWNRWYDHYQWHRNSPIGENFHQADVYSLGLNCWTDWRINTVPQKTAFGIECRNEGILSTKLGDPLDEAQWLPVHRGPADGHPLETDEPQYAFGANRTNVAAFLEHNILFRRLTISAGLLANLNSALSSRWHFYPGIDLAWRSAPSWTVFASWNMALRMPTFTDLYYSGKGIEGSRNLSPEHTSDLSLKAAFTRPVFRADAAFVFSHRTNMIDWVVPADCPTASPLDDPADPAYWVYRSGNFRLRHLGSRFNAAFLPRFLWEERCPLRQIALRYSFIDQHISYPRPILASKYAMEYVRHKLVASVDGCLFTLHQQNRPLADGGSLTLSLAYRYLHRVANDDYGMLDAHLAWSAPHYIFYIDAQNILNTNYCDFGFIPCPGLWISAGVQVRF